MAKNSCRFCGTDLEHTFADLGMSPLANSNLEPDQLSCVEHFYPLHAYVCHRCFLVQVEELKEPSEIFTEYAYLSSYSDSWVQHAKRYVSMITERLNLSKKNQVVEIASNDGYLLQFFLERGIPVLGIEPAANIARVAQQKEVPTLVKFFSTETAKTLVSSGMQADLLIGNNVLAHVPALNDFVEGLRIMLSLEGVITLEFPHLLKLIGERQFDTIYHEHFSYFSLSTVIRVLAHHNLVIFDVDELPTHGGSLRIYARHSEDITKPIEARVLELLNREEVKGLNSLATYNSFAEDVRASKRKLLSFLIEQKNAARTIVGYGAPAKGNTLLNYCGIRSDFIDYVVDRSPYKQGRFLPGTHIPIYHPDRIAQTKPDYLLLLPWNLRDEIMAQMAFVREWGCRFVTPIPTVHVYS